MAAKTEAPPPAPEAAPAVEAAAAPAPTRGIKAWIPTIAAIVLAPVGCWAVAQFVLIPQLKKSLTIEIDGDPVAVAGATPGTTAAGGTPGKAGPKAAEPVVLNTYKFENVVVNLAGTMGTRYLKTTFLVSGPQADIAARFEGARPQLLDVTISVLSSLSLSDLEEPGAKNVIREKLVNSYNQTLGQRVADQVYFSEFVVQ